jgi:hypothetical protein
MEHDIRIIKKSDYLSMTLSQLNQLYRDGWSFDISKDDENLVVFYR